MTRVKRSVHGRKKRRETLSRTKGYRGQAHSSSFVRILMPLW